MISKEVETNCMDVLESGMKYFIEMEANRIMDEQVAEFRRVLESRKDRYVAEIMKSIRVFQEINMTGVSYKIEVDNVYEVNND